MIKTNSIFNKLIQVIRAHIGFLVVVCVFSIVFIFKLFTNVLYDDEVGFYLSPTSRGVLFSFLSYGTTGYHILYAGLSAILDQLGNVYIAIRGVPFIAWILSNVVIYKTCLIKCEKNNATLAVLIYNMLYCTNFYAVGGRGYMLINLWLALAVYFSVRLMEDMQNKKLWICFVIVNICGFWTISTYMYAFFCVVIAWGLYLLFQKKYRDIWILFKYCVLIGIGVFLVYCPVFLFVHVYDLAEQGIIEKSNTVFLKTVLQDPLMCLIQGMGKFIDTTTYSISNQKYNELLAGLWDYFGKISEFVFFRPFPVLAKMTYIGTWLLSVVFCIRRKDNLGHLYGAVSLAIFIPIVFLQRVFPFERLFTFLGVFIAISMASVLEQIPSKLQQISRYLPVLFAVITVVLYLNADYINPHHDTIDDSVEKAVEQIPESLREKEKLAVYVDAFQQRNYMILWGRLNGIDVEFVEENPELAFVSNNNEENKVVMDGLRDYYSDAYIIAAVKE